MKNFTVSVTAIVEAKDLQEAIIKFTTQDEYRTPDDNPTVWALYCYFTLVILILIIYFERIKR